MNSHDTRVMALNMIKNSAVKTAQKKETISKLKLINEICLTFGVSQATAYKYIAELISMEILVQDGDLLWHNQEKEIQNIYLEKIRHDPYMPPDKCLCDECKAKTENDKLH